MFDLRVSIVDMLTLSNNKYWGAGQWVEVGERRRHKWERSNCVKVMMPNIFFVFHFKISVFLFNSSILDKSWLISWPIYRQLPYCHITIKSLLWAFYHMVCFVRYSEVPVPSVEVAGIFWRHLCSCTKVSETSQQRQSPRSWGDIFNWPFITNT